MACAGAGQSLQTLANGSCGKRNQKVFDPREVDFSGVVVVVVVLKVVVVVVVVVAAVAVAVAVVVYVCRLNKKYI